MAETVKPPGSESPRDKDAAGGPAKSRPGGAGRSSTPPRESSGDRPSSPPPELPGIMADDWRPGPGLRPIYEGLQVMLGGCSTGLLLLGDHYCYTILQERGELVARSWTNLAAKDKNVKAFFERMLVGGAWGETIFVTLSVAVPMAQHHVPALQRLPLPFGPTTTPADHDQSGAAEAARAAAEAVFGTDGGGEGEAPAGANVAEQQRAEAEARRKREGGAGA